MTYEELILKVKETQSVEELIALAKEKGVEMPITEAVYRILFEQEDCKTVLLSLFERQSKTEF